MFFPALANTRPVTASPGRNASLSNSNRISQPLVPGIWAILCGFCAVQKSIKREISAVDATGMPHGPWNNQAVHVQLQQDDAAIILHDPGAIVMYGNAGLQRSPQCPVVVHHTAFKSAVADDILLEVSTYA
jgi:hypothetical protein